MWETQSQEFYDSEDDLDERVNKAYTANLINDFVFLPKKTFTKFGEGHYGGFPLQSPQLTIKRN